MGDAGYTKDPVTAQGISDAFRDAELCATALDEAERFPSPRAALEAVALEALQERPCAVAFSGGRDSSSVPPQVVTLTSSESKYGVITDPPKPLPPSSRTANPPADR